jgi:hypothetical protein
MSIYIVYGKFYKIVAFKGTNRKFLTMMAVHTEGPRHPPYAYLTHFFRVNVPLSEISTCLYALIIVIDLKLNIFKFFFLLIVFYSGIDASFPEILFILHSHDSCCPSGDCGESGIEIRDYCVTAWFQLVDLTTELPLSCGRFKFELKTTCEMLLCMLGYSIGTA